MVGELRSVDTSTPRAVAVVCGRSSSGRHRDGDTGRMGQRRIPGIECGRTLRVRGRLGTLDNGGKAIYNPHSTRSS